MGIKNIIGELQVNGKPVLTENYSARLAYISNEDGTCAVTNGSCTDSVVVIPKKSPAGDSVVTIQEYAFNSCDWITDVIIPDGVTNIRFSAFDMCDSLRNIVIPSSVTSIEYEAFNGCNQLSNIYYTGSKDQWAHIQFNSGDARTELLNATCYYNYADNFMSLNTKLESLTLSGSPIYSELHIEPGSGEGSFQQSSDTSGDDPVYVGEDDKEYFIMSATVHPEAPVKAGEAIPFGAVGYYSKALSGKGSAQGWRSTVDGTTSVASGDYAYAHGDATVAQGKCSRAVGSGTYAKGYYSHASGQGSMAEGACSTAEGETTKSVGRASHSEGLNTNAGGNYSHAEGNTTSAAGNSAHTEGRDTEAKGYYAHAEGRGTIARARSQHAEGEYNIQDPKYSPDARGTYIHIAGNGTSSKRSNAYTLDWSGNAWFAGDIYIGGAGQSDENTKKLATESYVDDKLGDVSSALDLLIAQTNALIGGTE